MLRIGRIALLVTTLLSAHVPGANAEPPTETVKMARKRFQEGVAAADAGNFEAARVAFQQAYALKPHPSVLLNLGQAEVRTGHFLEAARHVAAYLRDTTSGTPGDRKMAAGALSQAESKIGKILMEVDTDGAEATVDGELIGRSPFGREPFYLEAGQRKLRVKKDGYQDYEQSLSVEAGRTTHLSIALRRMEAPPLQALATEAPRPASAPAAPPAAPEARPSPLAEPDPWPASSTEQPVRATASVDARTVVLIGGAAFTGVALGIGIVERWRGVSLDGEAQDARSQLPAPCASSSGSQCGDLANLLDRRNRANALATGAFVTAGVLAAATGVTYALWPRKAVETSRIRLDPAAWRGGGGLWLNGRF